MRILFFSLLVLVMLSGCDEPAATTSNTSSSRSSSGSGAPPPPPGATDIDGANVVYDETDKEPAELDDDGFEREVAKTGVGKKGRNYGGWLITEPIRQRFRIEQQLQLQNVTKAMRMYRAEFGYFPKTEEEFMNEIIQANSIELPELPEGERYVYEAKTGELMVERPKR